jgi:transcriptional regulator with XRE-family HTH domain
VPDPVLVLFGQRIRSERKARGWSQAELAHRAGVTGAAISDWEAAAHGPSLAGALRAAGALEVPLADLLAPPGGAL